MSRRRVLPLLSVIVLFSLPLLPEIAGGRRLIFRDAQITHWPWRRVAVESLRSCEVPFVNATASGGQPLLANPNAVLLYPTFLLERVFAPATAFNLHYLLHVLWAFLGARALARRLDLSEGAAFFSGVAFAFSGMVLSYGSAFMNSIAAASWLPWCAAGFVELSRAESLRARIRAGAALGLALGLQLLAGEPALSLLTLAFGGALALSEALVVAPERRGARLLGAAAACVGAGLLACAFAAPLLLPLRAVYPLTYRGQHLFSAKAFGAAAFLPWRALEWFLPRFGGDPGLLGGGASWLRAIAAEDLVYIWCVTFGVVPLLAVVLGLLRRPFWNRRSVLMAALFVLTLLFAFGWALPFYRLLFAVAFLRRLRYPIKFYLLTTLCVALLAGRAAEGRAGGRLGRREGLALAAAILLFAVCWALAAPGGLLDRLVQPMILGVSSDPRAFLETFRGAVRGDALIGALSVLLVALVLGGAARLREPGYALGFLTLIFSFVWGLPLFVSAPDRDLAREPALLRKLRGEGRLYVSPELPRFDPKALPSEGPGGLPRSSKVARILVEQLVPATAAPFGARYLFENDPDGSYGFYNRLVGEALTVSSALQRDRLLVLFGARWALAREGEEHPMFRPVTGFEVGGNRLVLFENPNPLPELRWAARAHRRASLSGSIELIRSDRFDPVRSVVLPGRVDSDAEGTGADARVLPEKIEAGFASAAVDAPAPGYLVFSRTFFPAWRARLDGRPARPVVANARDLAVAVPAGHHRVELEYDRGPFRIGVAAQAAAMVAALWAAVSTGGFRFRVSGRADRLET